MYTERDHVKGYLSVRQPMQAFWGLPVLQLSVECNWARDLKSHSSKDCLGQPWWDFWSMKLRRDDKPSPLTMSRHVHGRSRAIQFMPPMVSSWASLPHKGGSPRVAGLRTGQQREATCKEAKAPWSLEGRLVYSKETGGIRVPVPTCLLPASL